MLNKLSTVAVAVAAIAALGFEQDAHADTTWNDAADTGLVGTCGGTKAHIGYEYEPNLFPMTGDSGYIHIFAQTNGCYDSPIIEFRLPPGSTQDTSRAVLCGRGNLNSSNVETLPAQSATNECFQTPQFNAGAATYRYGWAKLMPDQWFEIMVPVKYSQRVPAGTFSGLVGSALGPINVAKSISVGYRAQFKSYAATNFGRGMGVQWGSWDGERVDIAFALHNYYEAGSLVIEYGTTPSFGSNLGTTPVPTGSQYYPSVTASLSGLTQNTTYYWRPKFVSPFGTFYGETQTFMTYAYLAPLPGPGPIYCRFPRC